MPESIVTNEDNMLMMSRFPDKFFSLAVVDPPYGLGIDGQKLTNNKNPKHNRKAHEFRNWDNAIPDDKYFNELFRVSQNQIIWGGNYFPLPLTKAWIFWYKGQNGLTMSDGELAWTSFDTVTRQVTVNRLELKGSIHPTQKPVRLYEWIYKNYLMGGGGKILDTHLGSGSNRIAAYKMGLDFWACEKDEGYFRAQNKRFDEHLILHGNQMFKPEIEKSIQTKLL